MKVATEEQRNNLKRKARLRKKLRVGEFKEYLVKLDLKSVNSLTDEDNYDDFLDNVESILDAYSFGVLGVSISDEVRTTVFIEVKSKDYSDHNLQKVVNSLKVMYNDIQLKYVDDAWYPQVEE